MRIICPIAGTAEALWDATDGAGHGHFPVGANHFWHGGVHLRPAAGEPVRCIADGEIVAYRLDAKTKDYEVPTAGAPADAPKAQYSSGFVLVKHRHVTPRKQEIAFYSLYMHLAPVTEEETKKDDLERHPFVFRRTHSVVRGDDEGGGMPIFEDRAERQSGVVPFGAEITVLPDDDKCKQQRYRHVRVIPPTTGYAPFVDDGVEAIGPYPRTRLFGSETLDLIGEDKKAIPQKLHKGAFFLLDEPPAKHWSRNWRYEGVAGLDGTTRMGIARVGRGATPFNQIETTEFHDVTAPVDLFDREHGGALVAIEQGEIVRKTRPPSPLPGWTKDDAHKQAGATFVAVEVLGVSQRGYAFLESARAGSRVRANADLPLLDESQAPAGTVASGSEYVVLERTAARGHWTGKRRYQKVFVFDLARTDGADGYAFVRDDMTTDLPRPAGTEKRDLRIWGVADHGSVPASPVLASADPDADPVGELDDSPDKKDKPGTTPTVFEVLPEAGVPKDHWSLSTGWRRIRYAQPALSGGRQPALTREGYAFFGTHAETVPPASARTPDKDQKFRLKTAKDVKALGLNKRPRQGVPPTVAMSYSTGNEWGKLADQVEKQVGEPTRPFDGLHNGVILRTEAKADARIVGVLGTGTVLQFDEDVPYALKRGADGTSDYTCKEGFYKTKDGHFAKVSPTTGDIVKRCQIPEKELAFGKVVELAVPVPVACGDILGFPGCYLEEPSIVHFEVFVGSRDFTGNPNGDTWGEKLCEVEGTGRFVREAVELAERTLPARVSFRVLERRGRHARVELLEIQGWMKADSLEPPQPLAPGGPRKLKVSVPAVSDAVVSQGKGKDGVEHFELAEKPLSAIVGRVGDEVDVLDEKAPDGLVKVRARLGALAGGWVHDDALGKGRSEKVLREDVGDGTYRYTTKAEEDVYDSDPNEAFTFRAPTAAETTAVSGAAGRLTHPESKKVRVPIGRVQTAFGREAKKDAKGKVTLGGVETWKGIQETDGAAPAFWVRERDLSTLSVPYDWKVDWVFFDEPGAYSEDGFCDADALLKLVDDRATRGGDAGGGSAPPAGGAGGSAATAPTASREAGGASTAELEAERAALRKKLRRAACQHPSEWDAGDLDKRFGRLQRAPWRMVGEDGKPNQTYRSTLDHIRALSFWSDVKSLPSSKTVWHFHPVGFVAQMQKLGWITRADLVAIAGASHGAKIDHYLESLNDALETYGITSDRQRAHFFSQTVWESGFFENSTEGAPFDYTGKLGNTLKVDNHRFVGRGLIQITGRETYEAYERKCGVDVTSTDAAAAQVAALPMAVDSAGCFYVDHKRKIGSVDKVARTVHGWAERGDEVEVPHVTLAINGGYNHLGSRVRLYARAKRTLYDCWDGGSHVCFLAPPAP